MPCHLSWIKSSALHMRGPRAHAEGEPRESTAALLSLQDLKLVNVEFLWGKMLLTCLSLN